MKPLFFAVLLLASACTPPSQEIVSEGIDVDSLLLAQVRILNERKVQLSKSATVSAHPSDTSFIPTADQWRAELEVFLVFGTPNQKLYAGTYRAEGPMDDPRSNLSIRRYSNDQAPLRFLEIYYQGDFSRIRQLTGLVEEINPLYSTRRKLTLQFDDFNGTPALHGYFIEGFQKVVFRDTVRFALSAAVHW